MLYVIKRLYEEFYMHFYISFRRPILMCAFDAGLIELIWVELFIVIEFWNSKHRDLCHKDETSWNLQWNQFMNIYLDYIVNHVDSHDTSHMLNIKE